MAWSIFKQGGGKAVAVGWAQQFLTAIGAPVTPGNVQFIYQWETAEGGGGKYNPLNTGPVTQHPEWTTTGEQYGGGAADYSSWETGILGPKYFLEHYQKSWYPQILSALKSNNPEAARRALWASPWAASHYGHGDHWPNVSVPGGAAVLPSTEGIRPADPATGGGGGTTTIPGLENVAAVDSPQCAWNVKTSFGSTCLISKVNLRHVMGITVIAGSTIVALIGVTILVAFGLSDKATSFIPGASAVKGAVGKIM